MKQLVVMKRIVILFAGLAFVCSCGVFSRNDAAVSSPSEEIVDIGYGKAVRGNLTTSVSTVNVESASSVPYQNIYEMISGRCPGVQVQGKVVTIRGINSINGNTEPLFVVDGNPMDSIDWINPSDVKDINVLKDAGATAIYGSRGANGVILINLK